MPKISIITISYNNLEGLKRTLESVVNQTWQEFEYIVIDGASSDGSAEYIQSQSDRIDYWISEPDKGIYNAMNKGIVKATGEYLLFLNSGDWLLSNEILGQIQREIYDEDLIYFNLKVVLNGTLIIREYPRNLDVSYFFQRSLPHPATFIKRELLIKLGGYDEQLRIVSDWKFFMISLIKFNASYRYISNVFSVFNLEGLSSLLENIDLLKKEREKVIDAEFSFLKQEINDLKELRSTINSLKKSRKIKLLQKFKLLNYF